MIGRNLLLALVTLLGAGSCDGRPGGCTKAPGQHPSVSPPASASAPTTKTHATSSASSKQMDPISPTATETRKPDFVFDGGPCAASEKLELGAMLQGHGELLAVGAPARLREPFDTVPLVCIARVTPDGLTWSAPYRAPNWDPTGDSMLFFGRQLGFDGTSLALPRVGNFAATDLLIVRQDGSSWVQEAALKGDGDSDDHFGIVVALSAGRLAAAASSTSPGAALEVRLYERSGSTWNARQRIAVPEKHGFSNPILAMSPSGRTLLVAWAAGKRGILEVHRWNGAEFASVHRLEFPGERVHALTTSDDRLVVHTRQLDNQGPGRVRFHSEHDGKWSNDRELQAPRVSFGASLAIDGPWTAIADPLQNRVWLAHSSTTDLTALVGGDDLEPRAWVGGDSVTFAGSTLFASTRSRKFLGYRVKSGSPPK